jgi:hypothetical protein
MSGPDYTEVTWRYEPSDFFEAPYENRYDDWQFSIAEGHATATVNGGQPSEGREQRMFQTIRSVFNVRSLQTGRTFKLEDAPNIVELSGPHRKIVVRAGAGSFVIAGGQLDFTITDSATGAVLRDSKAERLAAVTFELNDLSQKAQHSQALRSMLASWSEG